MSTRHNETVRVLSGAVSEEITSAADGYRTISALLRERAKRYPERAALLAPAREPISYAGLLRKVEETITALNDLKIGAGDCVAVVLADGPELAVIFLALAAAGVACAPLNPAYRQEEFDFYLSDLSPKALIAERGVSSPAIVAAEKRGVQVVSITTVSDAAAGTFTLDAAAPRALAAASTAADDVALLLHTSGTTSRPKKVALTHANLCHSALSIAASLALTPDDRSLNVMPLFHVHGLIGSIVASIAAGGSVVCTAGFRAPAFFDWLERFQPTWYTAAPTIHQAILARLAHGGRMTTPCPLRFIRSCSAPLPRRVMEELERTFTVPVIEAYGMTEAAHQIASNPLPPRARKPGSVGVATGTAIGIMDDRGDLLHAGHTGEVVVRGPSVMSGYSGGSENQDNAFVDGWFKTGDLGSVDDEGYLFLHARTKELINRGGEKISPSEIDDVLTGHPAVVQAAAFAVPDVRLGEDVGAAVVLRDGASVTEEELRRFAAQRLAAFKVPRWLVFVPEIPKGPTGKLQRIDLAQRLGLGDSGLGTSSAPFVAPRNSLEGVLAAIWQQILRVDHVGVHDNFFDIGGDSLSAVELAVRVEHVLRIELSIGGLMQSPTIGQLAAAIAKGDASLHHPRLTVIQPGTGSKRPFFCVDAGPMFRNLAARLGADQPFLSLYCPDTTILPVPYRLEDVAAYHIETMRQVQPEGPYRISGWCIAGLVAYEMAQQLRAQGERIDLLVLFDTVNPVAGAEPPPKADATRSFDFLQRLLRAVDSALRKTWSRRAPRETAATLAWIVQRVKTRAQEAYYDASVNLRIPLIRALRNIEIIQRLAVRHYRPQPCPGRVVLFQRSLRLDGTSPRLGWHDFVEGQLDVHAIPGDHADMFREPHVRSTAEVLTAYLSEPEQNDTGHDKTT